MSVPQQHSVTDLRFPTLANNDRQSLAPSSMAVGGDNMGPNSSRLSVTAGCPGSQADRNRSVSYSSGKQA
ncbi:unnamed protein product [Protopolystoma xenopodis]|uniref:Uncharacterized protein n=1 Tax=Protopolystoma xenopodis TaxID=117903 RepID=A0A448XKW6_9PLAT|nr:unnamed protein product [Protopolystoma xenopodis]